MRFVCRLTFFLPLSNYGFIEARYKDFSSLIVSPKQSPLNHPNPATFIEHYLHDVACEINITGIQANQRIH